MLPKLSTLSSELQLIVLVGYNENAGHKLVSESAAEEFEAGFVKGRMWGTFREAYGGI